MDISQTFWEENSNMQPVKYESCNSNDEHPRMKDEPNLYRYCDGNLNFATVACSEDDSEYGSYHKKTKVSRQDPMSHRIIEKRRRDRMNNCLADLSRLIPADYLKKGRGRIEKTEIIEMAIKHMKYLQQTRVTERSPLNTEHYRLGFQECMSETMRFLVEVEGFFAHEALCVKLINHLQSHCEAVLTSDRLHTGTCTVPSNKNTGNCTRPIVSPVISPNGQTHTDPSYDTNSQLRDMLSSTSIKDSSNTNSVTNHHTVANHRDSNHINGMMINDTRVLSPVNNEKDQISSEDLYSNIRNGRNKNLYEYQRQEPEDMSQHLSEVNSLYTTDSKIMNYDRIRQTSENEGSLYDKSRECTNGASLYKFKNNIMQRINQESISESISNHSLNKSLKRKKLTDNMDHRISLTENNFTYSENHSNSPTDGSQTSPHSSDVYTRISSESDNPSRISPTGSSVSDNKQMERQSPKRFSNFPKHQISQHSHDLKNGNASHFGRSSPNNMKNNAKNSINQHFQTKNSEKPNFGIPIFVLHAKGSFYIPLTIDYHTLMPYLQNYNILDITHSIHNIILHPVTINVNFQPNNLENVCPAVNKQIKYKTEVQNGWH